MAPDVVRAVLWRRANDPAFKEQWDRDAEQLLHTYSLTDEERQALRTNDRERLRGWGIPEELLR